MRLGFIYNVIYKSKCLYVGSTWNFKKRMVEHKSECYNPKRKKYKKNLYKFIRATDVWSAFHFTIIDTIETDDSDEDDGQYELWTAEQYYIDMLEPTLNEQDAIVSPEERRKRQAEANRNRGKINIETKRYSCAPCGYAGSSKKNLDRHYTSNKHKQNIN
jgi:group I intron endonuclease